MFSFTDVRINSCAHVAVGLDSGLAKSCFVLVIIVLIATYAACVVIQHLVVFPPAVAMLVIGGFPWKQNLGI